MKNITDLSVNELQELACTLLDETKEDILKLPIDVLISMVENEEKNIDIETERFEEYLFQKHDPNRKKKSKNVKKNTIEYKKIKTKKWVEPSRRNTPIEFSNRAYINKASKSYLKLKPNVNTSI